MKLLSFCPICQSETQGNSVILRSVVKNDQYSLDCILNQCHACGHVFLNPQPTDEEIISFYNENYQVFSNSPMTASKINDLIEKRFDGKTLIHAPVVSGGRYLEIGCGLGNTVEAMSRVGMDAQGIDLSPIAVEIATTQGRNVICSSLEKMKYPSDTFDTIAMYHALEHVPDPVSILQECDRILKPGGQIVIVVPNIESIFFKVLGQHWYPLQLPYHFHHFSSKSLRRAFSRTSLQEKHIIYETVQQAVEEVMISGLRRYLLIPHRFSSKLRIFAPLAKWLANYADQTNKGETIVALFQK